LIEPKARAPAPNVTAPAVIMLFLRKERLPDMVLVFLVEG
jgi:hypothetical protein